MNMNMKEARRKEKDKEEKKKKRNGGVSILGDRRLWALQTVGPHINHARST